MAALQPPHNGNRLAFKFVDVLTISPIVQPQPISSAIGSVGLDAQTVMDMQLDVSPAWSTALMQAHLQQGDGTPDFPIYVGAENLMAAPVLVEPTVDPSSQTSVDRVRTIQRTLLIAFRTIVFHNSRDYLWFSAKLHPWAAINWVNMFTSLIFSQAGISNANAILAAAGNAVFNGPAHPDAATANILSVNPAISRKERAFFRAFAQVVDAYSLNRNPFTRFARMCAQAGLAYSVADLVDDVGSNPQGEAAQSMQGQQSIGTSIRGVVVRTCADRMQLQTDQLSMQLRRNANFALSTCVASLTGGFLLFVDDAMLTIIENNAKAALPAMMPILTSRFPELAVICGQIYNTLVRSLMSTNPNIRNGVAGQQIDTTVGGVDMIHRIRVITG